MKIRLDGFRIKFSDYYFYQNSSELFACSVNFFLRKLVIDFLIFFDSRYSLFIRIRLKIRLKPKCDILIHHSISQVLNELRASLSQLIPPVTDDTVLRLLVCKS